MATGTIATRTGTMLVPGVSLNRRLYTKELITKAVERMQERISSPDGLPIVMRTHHDAGDNSALIVGKVTAATVNDQGIARYESALYDTPEGRTIATLTDPKNPALKSTSIHGYWLGPVRRISHENKTVETGDDMEIDAIDFTASPGVVQAQLDGGSDRATESATARTPISESFDATAETSNPGVDEKGAPALKSGKKAAPQTKAKNYADPGYQDDGAQRYALDTKAQVKAAWSYINMPKNAAKYTKDQLGKVKARIKAAAKKLGIDISSDETRLIDRWWTETTESAVAEYYGDDMPSARFSVSVSNGPIDVVVSSYSVDPADLDVVARAAMDGACKVLAGMDPDNDGDVDVPGMVGDSATETQIVIDGTVWTEDQLVEAVRNHIKLRKGALTLNELRAELGQEPIQTPPADAGDTEESTEEGEPTVSEATTDKAAETTGAPDTTTRNLTDGDVAAIGAAFAAAVSGMSAAAPAAPAPAPQPTETAPAVQATESTTKVSEVQELKEAVVGAMKDAVTALTEHVNTQVTEQSKGLRDELREALVKAGVVPARKGVVTNESADGGQDNLTPAQLFDNRADVLLGNYARTPVPHTATGTAVWPTPQPAAAQ